MNRECGKNRYRMQEEAEKAMKAACRHTEREKLPVRVYTCPNCGGWHMTSRKRKASGKVIKNKAFKRFLKRD